MRIAGHFCSICYTPDCKTESLKGTEGISQNKGTKGKGEQTIGQNKKSKDGGGQITGQRGQKLKSLFWKCDVMCVMIAAVG